MNAQEYLNKVARTIATLGHRENAQFRIAFEVASCHAGDDDSMAQVSAANSINKQIVRGLKSYVPGAKYFDPIVAVEYATLTARDNFTE
jgi:hypothetical protein